MIKRLLEKLIEADVPDRRIVEHWEYIGPIGSCLNKDYEVRVEFIRQEPKGEVTTLDTLQIYWETYVGNTILSVCFNLTEARIHYSAKRFLLSVPLTKDNIVQSIGWLSMLTHAFKEHRYE